MQVSPKKTASLMKPWIEYPGELPFVTRQSKIKTGKDQYDVPRPRQLDKHRPALAKQQFAVQIGDEIHQALVIFDDVHCLRSARVIHHTVELTDARHNHLRSAGRCRRWFVVA